MKKTVKHLWTAELRNPNQLQGTGRLERDGRRCCLGVLCRVAMANGLPLMVGVVSTGCTTFDDHTGLLPERVQEWSELQSFYGELDLEDREGEEVTLVELNDGGMPFTQIADMIDYFL